MNIIQIKEVDCSVPLIVTSMSSPNFRIETETGTYYATVKCMDADGKVLTSREVEITKNEYDEWGTDDDYIVNLVLSKLNFERK